MKIAYLMQAGVPNIRQRPLSGPANHVKHVFVELGKLGHQVCLLVFLDGQVWKSEDLENYERVTVRWIDKGPFRLFERTARRIQYELQLPYAGLFESLRFMIACCQELVGYDLLYERMGWMGYGGALAARWLDLPLILEVNGDHLSEMEIQGNAPQGVQRSLSTLLMKNAILSASYTVATGEGWRKRFIDRWNIDRRKITVVENGSELLDILQRSQLRSFNPHPNSNGVTTIVYLGGFDPWQGVTILIRTIARIIADGLPVRLLLIGSGAGVKTAEQLVCRLSVGQYVTFTGPLTSQQYAVNLADADIGVAPYCGWGEYSGLKLFDYKAAGLAIIASGENGQPAVIDHGKTGWIVTPCDENALYEAIVRLISDSELAKRMAREARIEAERHHSWKNTVVQLNELFNEVIKDYGGNSNGN